jgi:PIN domain nuclease of toxin-antitoxin system
LTAVLDAWAVLALLGGEPAAARVQELILAERTVISSINLGEALYWTERKCGQSAAHGLIEQLRAVMEVEAPDWPLVSAAAHVKAGGGLSYADAFCVATAQRHRAMLYTGDPEILALDGLAGTIDLRETPPPPANLL